MNRSMLIVLDTNVLVSAQLKKSSAPAKILDAFLEGKLQIAVDDRIMDEYQRVLHRPRFNFPTDQVDFVLKFISQNALWVVNFPINFPLEQILDPGDLPFSETAISSNAEALVTGNIKHFTYLHDVSTHGLMG
jgi:putative PIN family toxin of toxin-antitoxin system